MIVRRLLLAIVVLLAAIQLIRPARSNPPVDGSKSINASIPVNPAAGAILQRSCKDCHSNQTVWPWYSGIAPVSWLVTHDVNEGRGKMNFSEWSAYDSAEAHTLLEHMCKEVTEDKMPPRDYTVMHAGTAMSGADVKTVCDWTATVAR